jgi:hypothetical protein
MGNGTFLMTGGMIEAIRTHATGTNDVRAISTSGNAKVIITGGVLKASNNSGTLSANQAATGANNSVVAISAALPPGSYPDNFRSFSNNSLAFTYTPGTHLAETSDGITIKALNPGLGGSTARAVWSKGNADGSGTGNGVWVERAIGQNGRFIALDGVTVNHIGSCTHANRNPANCTECADCPETGLSVICTDTKCAACFGNPPTGIPGITGYLWAMILFLAISAALWVYILRRRLLSRN